MLWDGRNNNSPIYTLSAHQAAVKAISWCPWQPRTLASGGGTNDREIRFWNTSSGTCLNSVDTGSQVCGILWNEEYKEIVTGHGFSHNQLTVWKYPAMTKGNLVSYVSFTSDAENNICVLNKGSLSDL